MRPGEPLGNRYRLERRVAAGGMGEVWRAIDTKLARPVAIKVLHPALADDASFRERFAHEARTVAALRAPGVVNLYDACEETRPDGSVNCYLVMEYVAGQSLAALLAARGRLPSGDALPLIVQAAEALEVAHNSGVIHRDVKPGNILVNPDGLVTLVDFGIARVSGAAGLTATGIVMGTLSYASPEHLLGRELTDASDIYSLGVVAYECLAGTLPFTTTSPAATITSQLRDTPPPMPPDVPAAVARTVLRALAKKPDDRFATAAEFAIACRRAHATAPEPAGHPTVQSTVDLAGRAAPPASRPPTTRPRPRPQPRPQARARADADPAWQPPRRRNNRAALLAATIVVLIIATVAGIGLWNGSPDGQAPPGTGAAGSPTNPPSASSTPRRPPTPAKSPIGIVGGRYSRCLTAEPGPAVKFGDCNDADPFRFIAVGGKPQTYQIVLAANPRKCLHLDTARAARLETCRTRRAWKVTWLTTVDGWHHWKLQYIGNSKCLGLDGPSTPGAGPCTGDDATHWRTLIP